MDLIFVKKCVVFLPYSVLTVEYVILLFSFALFDVLEKVAKQVTCRVTFFFLLGKQGEFEKHQPVEWC